MTLAVVTQPTYLPWLGYLEAIARADEWVALDVVQFQRRSWQSRNRLKGADGEPFWLSVPTVKAPRDAPLGTIRIADDGWAAKHVRALQLALGSAPHGEAALDAVVPVLDDPPELLVDLNLAIIHRLADLLGLAPRWSRASALPVEGARSDLLIRCCQAVGADRYYSAAGAGEYLAEDRAAWDAAGIAVELQAWEHPTYPQQGPGGFVSHLAAVDAIANLGPDEVRRTIGAAP